MHGFENGKELSLVCCVPLASSLHGKRESIRISRHELLWLVLVCGLGIEREVKQRE